MKFGSRQTRVLLTGVIFSALATFATAQTAAGDPCTDTADAGTIRADAACISQWCGIDNKCAAADPGAAGGPCDVTYTCTDPSDYCNSVTDTCTEKIAATQPCTDTLGTTTVREDATCQSGWCAADDTCTVAPRGDRDGPCNSGDTCTDSVADYCSAGTCTEKIAATQPCTDTLGTTTVREDATCQSGWCAADDTCTAAPRGDRDGPCNSGDTCADSADYCAAGTCTEKIAATQPCTDTTGTTTVREDATCQSGWCAADDTCTAAVPDGVLAPGTPCTDTSDSGVIRADATCVSGWCGETDECTAAARGDRDGPCNDGNTCTDSVADYCNSGVCTEKIAVGQPCTDTVGATTVREDATCQSGWCGADDTCTTVTGGDGTKVLGEACEANADCDETTFTCSQTAAVCVRKVSVAVGETCAIDTDCTGEATCIKATENAATGLCTAPSVPKTIGQSCQTSGEIDRCGTGLSCTGKPAVCISTAANSVGFFGECAVSADCTDVSAGNPAYCERANATLGIPGRCVKVRPLGAACAQDNQCSTGKCADQSCALNTGGTLIAQAVVLPSVAVVANKPATVALPGGVDLTLTSLAGGNVEVTAAGTPPTGVPQPPGKGVALFLSINAPEGLSDASLDFQYLEAIQEDTGVPGDELTWYTFDEDKKEWVSCAEEDTTWNADSRILSCRTEHFSDWTISTKVSAAFATYIPSVLTVVTAALLSLGMVL
ncbi:hypothetical protein HDU85_000833 [Gaertneriomyces sp. JEL0708]|nr:hypothetical protein HDU85_000833 [Gaertneriomyces sp. JEL0708]